MTFKLLLISIAFFLCFNIQGQDTGHYFFVNAGGGLHALSYDLQNGKQKGGAGFTINGGYNYSFSPHWGLETGLGIQSLQSVAIVNYMTSTPAIDTDGDAYEFRTYYKNWKEKQTAYLLDIPLGISFRKNISEKLGWTASVGAKISIPLSCRYEVRGGEIATTGYYSRWNAELTNMPQHGFSTITERFKGNTSLNPSYAGYADLGALYQLSSKVDFYAGAYINYGLNNMVKASDKLVYQKDGSYNGVLNSDQADKGHLISLGIKIGLRWNLGHKKTAEKVIVPAPMEEIASIANEPKPLRKAIIDSTITVAHASKTDSMVLVVATVPQKNNEANDSVYARARAVAASTEIKFALNTSVKPMRSDDNKIKALSEWLKANPVMKLTIIGHTCDIASREVNLHIGTERAKAVKDIFLQLGVSETQLQCQTKAFDEPLVPNTSEENRAKNRRVELKIN